MISPFARDLSNPSVRRDYKVNTPVKLYHELRKVSPEKARMLVRKILDPLPIP